MSVAVDRTARGVVIFHGLAGAFIGAIPAAIAALLLDKPGTNPWFRDLLICGSLLGAFIGGMAAIGGMLHEDLRSLRRQRQSSNYGEPHMEKPILPAPPRGSSASHEPLPSPSDSEQDMMAYGADSKRL